MIVKEERDMAMNEEMIFNQIDLSRNSTLQLFEGLTEEQADLIPQGFNNNIRWNLGHIYTVQNTLLNKFGGKSIKTPPRYLELFTPGTKPAEWQGEVPTLDELKQLLEAQPAQLKEALAGQLQDEAIQSFQSLSTVGEILSFTTFHEGMHVGVIKGLKKANAV
ncbi:DinB family protein [Paraliobacillus ryukyuensis]|uniref:DinB family protein n=1 Tax=Paraliobacillus ryukyuensis TaxID=200904 RepID=UPI0021193004|nr:DinB family protein [Paraliobacillus ryukyuensis]